MKNLQIIHYQESNHAGKIWTTWKSCVCVCVWSIAAAYLKWTVDILQMGLSKSYFWKSYSLTTSENTCQCNEISTCFQHKSTCFHPLHHYTSHTLSPRKNFRKATVYGFSHSPPFLFSPFNTPPSDWSWAADQKQPELLFILLIHPLIFLLGSYHHQQKPLPTVFCFLCQRCYSFLFALLWPVFGSWTVPGTCQITTITG